MTEKCLPSEIIHGPRIELRKHRLDIAQNMFGLINSNRDKFAEFLPWVKPTQAVDDTLNYIKDAQNKWLQHELFDYGIFRSFDGQLMGNIGVHHIVWKDGVCELGYWIGKEFQKNGFVREATNLLTREMFRLGFHRIEIRCSETNASSRRVPESLGFKLEGVLRENAFDNGIRRNTVIYGILKKEF